ncbi:MAG: MarR family winged helix-turn-helix transcriptional regulator [Thermoleophilia bacterium]
MSADDVDALVEALAELRARVVPTLLARQERRRDGATPGERLSIPQHLTLLALSDGPRAVTDVAESSGVAVSSATRMLQSLEACGWVERAETEPGDDRRRRPVTLTAEGREVLAQADAVLRRRLRAFVSRVDADGRRALLEGLRAFDEALHADGPQSPQDASKIASTSASVGGGGAS